MPVQIKDKLLQIRTDQAFLERVSSLADRNDMTTSAFVRRVLERAISQMEERIRKDAEWDATLSSRAVAAQSAQNRNKPPGEAVVLPESPLARKRRLEKEAKAAKMKKRAEAR
jgi:antitoxin component of RelBE/YafQ-DinJ toxin-antitoxin module